MKKGKLKSADPIARPIPGTFLVFGTTCEPGVFLLSGEQTAAFYKALSFADDPRRNDREASRRAVYRQTFGVAADYAIPGWHVEPMAALALHYIGAYQERVRAYAACLATGTPYGGPDASDGPDGGQKAKLEPVQPIEPRPGGAAVRPQYSVSIN